MNVLLSPIAIHICSKGNAPSKSAASISTPAGRGLPLRLIQMNDIPAAFAPITSLLTESPICTTSPRASPNFRSASAKISPHMQIGACCVRRRFRPNETGQSFPARIAILSPAVCGSVPQRPARKARKSAATRTRRFPLCCPRALFDRSARRSCGPARRPQAPPCHRNRRTRL